MPDAKGSIRYLKRLPEYNRVKPYLAAVPANGGSERVEFPLTNLQFEEHVVEFVDIRPFLDQFNVRDHGFQILPSPGRCSPVTTPDSVATYQRETEEALTAHFGAEKVICFEFKVRNTKPFDGDTLDLEDPLQHLQPAPDAHADYTFVSGPITTKRVLVEQDQEQYMRPGYRFQIINTWQSALPEISDQPLAVCDFRSTAAGDVIASDRVRPDKTGEIFHLHFNPDHKWYFLDSMTPQEPWMFVSYDSMAGHHARFCPHASFHPEGRQPSYRESYETRSLVITRLDRQTTGSM
ncbi:hypothetical protein CEP51_001900 [Fusarium floridanum]|uniref:Methyltransferase n=1 Tax=Fusarium floridanum TaxID=1325733 RepID=A0A428SE34_9HYPO|nr:hypothetical protein CEP51_001900 [Fusarium floridanum]